MYICIPNFFTFMKKIFLILLILISLNVVGQIKVKEGSFKKIEGYVMLDKKEHSDDNNQPMALIKISTENINAEQRRNFIFKGNLATYFDVHFEPGEIHLYISAAYATFIEIIHDDLGKTEFTLPFDLCDFCGYEMVVQYIPIDNNKNHVKPQNNFLSIITNQADADIYIDDNYVGQKEVFKSFPIGSSHTWRIECNLYHSESGNITITDQENIINKTLRPAYGYLKVTSLPENGALVYIDNKKVGVTPYISDKLASGSYKIRIMKEMFKTVEQTFEVTDGDTTNVRLNMSANFVDVTIKTDLDSDIYIDEDIKGKGSWTGRLSDGAHLIEVKKASHETIRKEINLSLGSEQIITIDAPKPIYGFLEISSDPMQADIIIDGNNIGKTPKVISNILIGEHELRLEKVGCAPIIKNIIVNEGETLMISERLQTGKEIVITTDSNSDKIYIDDNYIGYCPTGATLTYGTHRIKIERNNKVIEKHIEISPLDSIDSISISFYEPLIFTVNNVNFTMIAVEGGSFDMGANYFESDNDERTIHNVTLNDFYIGETEVTQELWEAVMGTDINIQKEKSSYGTKLRGVGNDYPMYYVNWYEAKEFCNILSEMTGKTFRLPTESEWEYAARGGNKSNNYKYSGSNTLYEEAWYYDNSDNSTHIIKTKKPNELGIHDMSGNVWEWCEDWYANYNSYSEANPTGPSSGTYKVIRGGSWSYGDDDCRIHNRYSNLPSYRYDDYGFRIVMIP